MVDPSAADEARRKDSRFLELMARHLEGRLAPGEMAELDAILLADRDRADEFLDTHLIASSMAEFSAAWLEAGSQPARERVAHSDTQARAQTANASTSLLRISYWRKHRVRFGALAMALTVLLWVGVGYLVLSRMGVKPQDSPVVSPVVAHVSALRSPQWVESAELFGVNDSLESGDTLSLQSGFVEITFQDGAVVLLQAPVNFTIDSRGAGTLNHGRLVARIEKQAETPEITPFAIYTPLAQIIDLGTEFGVDAQEDGPTEVRVFQGLIEAIPQGAASTPQSRPLRLTEGQAARIAAGAGVVATNDSDEFIRDMPAENAKTVLLAVDNYRTVDMIRTTAGARMMTVYAFHHPHESNVLLSFDLSPYYGQEAAGPGRLTLTTIADSVGQRAESASSHQLELRQLNTFNAGLDFDAASSFFLDGVENEGSTPWRSNSGEEIEQLNYEGCALDVTSGLIATKSGPFGGDTPTTLIAPGTHIVLTIPRETLQSWLDQTEAPVVLLGATGELDLIKFGTGEDQPAPSLRFDVVEPAAAGESTPQENP